MPTQKITVLDEEENDVGTYPVASESYLYILTVRGAGYKLIENI